MASKYPRLQRLVDETRALLEDRALHGGMTLGRMHRFVHFWILVWRSFSRNRCPVRASALAYLTLLSLVPLLAVVMSITSAFLKKEGEARIDAFVTRMVARVTPPDLLTTNIVASDTRMVILPQVEPGSSSDLTTDGAPVIATDTPKQALTPGEESTNAVVLAKFASNPEVVQARREIVRNINEFIQNTRTGALGVTGSILLIFAAISLLSRIEDTLNDIWGVARGRSWFMRIVLYWGFISLVPMLLVVAIGLASGQYFEATRSLVATLPFVEKALFQFLPLFVVWFTFSAIYMLMPNTKVQWTAALAGGLVGGGLFHLNHLLSVLYVSRVVTNSKIYGGLGVIPVFMLGLYFAWLILLFGAQVAYAWQNRATYFEEKQVENINQRGREFVALRLATMVGQYYLAGLRPPTATQLALKVGIPTRLVHRTMQTLCAAQLVVETAGAENGYLPSRPMETITCHDILLAMRASAGQELATRDEPTRSEVYGEYERIQQAERQAASSVTLIALAHRAQRQMECPADRAETPRLS